MVVRNRLRPAVAGRIVQAALAAGAAWELALQLHPRPFFAPIAAVIALGADRGRRGKQAAEIIVGVAFGILVGAALVAVGGVGWWQIVVAVLVTLTLGVAADATPVVRNQAAASAVLVVALHEAGSNLAFQRLEDALIGGGLAIVLAQVLFPIDPVELVLGEARLLRGRVADALDAEARAVRAGDLDAARHALVRIDHVDEHRVEEAVALARDIVRRAPRRRSQRGTLEMLARAALELGASVADAHAAATGAVRMLEADDDVPREAPDALEAAAGLMRSTDPAEAHDWDARLRPSVEALHRAESLGASVLAHGVTELAEHSLRAAEARATAEAS